MTDRALCLKFGRNLAKILELDLETHFQSLFFWPYLSGAKRHRLVQQTCKMSRMIDIFCNAVVLAAGQLHAHAQAA
jgi:hypothetical protein